MLPTNNSVPIENVVVAESGDDSEDEWDYIKVDKEKTEQERGTPVALQSEQEQKEDIHQLKEDIPSPTPPTFALEEIESINQESNALAPAIAQPEETCTEVMLQLFIYRSQF